MEAAVQTAGLDMSKELTHHCGIAHTRWATHGPPNEVNCHPHLSNAGAEFTVVHNGIITNCKEIRSLLEGKGYKFVSDTDTESISVLIQYVFDQKKVGALFGCHALALCTDFLVSHTCLTCSYYSSALYLCP